MQVVVVTLFWLRIFHAHFTSLCVDSRPMGVVYQAGIRVRHSEKNSSDIIERRLPRGIYVRTIEERSKRANRTTCAVFSDFRAGEEEMEDLEAREGVSAGKKSANSRQKKDPQ